MRAPLADFRGYHDCPCRDCFDVAIGGLRRSDAERARLADLPRNPDTGVFQGRHTTAADISTEDVRRPALCSSCEAAGCDHTGQSDCQRLDAYGVE